MTIMIKLFLRGITLAVLAALLHTSALAYAPVPISVTDTLLYGANIQRTMGLLASGKTVTIVFFGQSHCLDNNAWVGMLKSWLVATYPGATITFINRSIGACTSACIADKVATSIGSDNADLIIFHTYFDMPQESYENCLIRMKQHSPATTEILVFNDPVHDTPSQGWHDTWSYQLLPPLCAKHNLGLVNLRRTWQLYLIEHFGGRHNASALTYDGVHFNDEGNYVTFETMKRSFLYRAPTVSALVPQRQHSRELTSNKTLTHETFSLSGRAIQLPVKVLPLQRLLHKRAQ